MTRRALAASAAVTALALALTAASPRPTSPRRSAVEITDDGCAVATATATAGAVTFSLANAGSDVNEFEILAEDQLRIVGEKENVTPGQEVEFVAQLAPGTYYTACKFQQVGAPIGLAEFTVTGEASAVSADEQALADQAVTEYLAYVRSQAAELLPAVEAFAAAYAAGDDEAARSLFADDPRALRAHRAHRRGARRPRPADRLPRGRRRGRGPRLDRLPPHREGPLGAGRGRPQLRRRGRAWQDWAPSTPEERAAFGDGLVADVAELYDFVHSPRTSRCRSTPTG